MPSSSMRIINSSSTTKTRLPASRSVPTRIARCICAPCSPSTPAGAVGSIPGAVYSRSSARERLVHRPARIPVYADQRTVVESGTQSVITRGRQWPRIPAADESNAWSFSLRCAGAASAIRPCCAPWTKCRANILSPPDFARQRLCRPGAADRLRADHQPAFCRRLYDRTARGRAAAPRARSRHRLGLSGGGPVAAWRARW